MVDVALTTWYEFEETATNAVLYGVELNRNFDFVSALLTNITDANIADNGIADGAVIAADVIREAHLDYADADYGPRVMQIGKKTNTYQQLYVQGTKQITATNVTNIDVTIDYTNGDVVDGAEINFAIAPTVLTAYVITANSDVLVRPVAVGTDTMQINYDESDTLTITENLVLYWAVVGDV